MGNKKTKETKNNQSGNEFVTEINQLANKPVAVSLRNGDRVHVRGIPFGDMATIGSELFSSLSSMIEAQPNLFTPNKVKNMDNFSALSLILPGVVQELASLTAASIVEEEYTREKVLSLSTGDIARVVYAAVQVNDIELWVQVFFDLKARWKTGLEKGQPDWLIS